MTAEIVESVFKIKRKEQAKNCPKKNNIKGKVKGERKVKTVFLKAMSIIKIKREK